MASRINIDRLIKANSTRSTIYTPIIEAIVNSLESIQDAGIENGKIELVFYRKQTGLKLLSDDGSEKSTKITDIDIIDNGVGFNDDNLASFNTLHSDYKEIKGGKGFGRMFYRQYFKNVHVKSVYKEDSDDNQFNLREFDFTSNELTDNVIDSQVEADEAYTIVSLQKIREEEARNFEVKLDTIARKIIEHLMVYFVDDSYKCPRIVLRDDNDGTSLTLNDFFEKTNTIQLMGSEAFELTGSDEKIYQFKTKIFKIFYSTSASSIYLTAHQRIVTKTPIREYMNEYKDGFVEFEAAKDGKQRTKNYIVVAYVSGEYLDESVSAERGEFLFKKDASIFAPLTTKEIEAASIEGISQYSKTDVSLRQNKKKQIVQAHVSKEAPWLRSYVVELDPQSISYDARPDEINIELEKIKFNKDNETKREIKELIASPPEDEKALNEAIDSISPKVNNLGKNDLIQHIILRKAVLDLFKQAMKWDEEKRYKKEEAVHKLIFPMHKTSDEINYDKHNMWMIDERLSYHSYAASDIPLERLGDRPDLLVLDSPILMRDSDTNTTPINVVEFKRPQREGYSKDDDPLRQVTGYIDKIRSGKLKTQDGETISADANTPAYAYIVADLTDKMRGFCRAASLVPDPDNEGYHGFHQGWGIYFEVVSFKKLLKNAELRNKILFSKLGLL